ncbi:PilZ domain-containing protein [uncultured Sphingomonas sp.]|uniref:PilZ domain-containing protein n=1 Tax=uncultured Sphingomonas sp. TaxID=158754 RepID=UPI0035CA56FB
MADAINIKPSDLAATIRDELAAGQRSRRRDSLLLNARMSVAGQPVADIRIRNLSAGGLMIDNAVPMEIGTTLVIELRNVGAVPGKVAWYAEGRAGIAFDAPIDPIKARQPVSVPKI